MAAAMRWLVLGSSLAMLWAPIAIGADAFPTKAVRIVVNTAPGGLVDVETRLVAQKMSEYLKQPVVIENRAGGDGLIGIRAAQTAAPDGYTLLGSAYTAVIQMFVKNDAGYDIAKDFVGVGFVGRSPFIVVEAPSLPDKTFGSLVARAKANPGKLSYGSAGVGTVTHLGMEALMQKTGMQLQHIPYKGNGAAFADVIGGRVDTMLEAFGSSSGKIKSGQLKALGITSAERSASLPDVPTLAEQGAPGYEFYTWLGLFAPAGTPKDVVETLSKALRYATSQESVRTRFKDDGVETKDMTPEEFSRFVGSETKRVEQLVTELKIPKQ